MAEAVLQVVLENLFSLIQTNVGFIFGVDQDMKRLSSTLSSIQAVLADAEERQLTDRAIKNWLQKLTDAAHILDDILDECSTEALRLEQRGLKRRSASKVHIPRLSFHPKHMMFRHKIAKKIKEIRDAIDEISEERRKFHLHEVIIGKIDKVMEWRQTSSNIAQPQIYGREEDKNKIVEYFIAQTSSLEDVSVYPVVGIGGLGKTTLAQLVFNDERVTKHFELKIWVCVSDNFNLRKILKDIIESASGHAWEDLNLELLHKHAKELLQRKRYFLVLDDIWNEDQEKWDRLKYILSCGSKGTSILVTTRLVKVASIMGTLPSLHLSSLSDEDCWSLFKQRAFGPDNGESSKLVAIGKEIVKKCGGMPLAAKSLGSLLRFKNEEREWLYVKESKLWCFPQDENSILPALRLSYLNLPLKLRQCFAFCAIFPKNFNIEKNLLVQLWMANSFVSSNGKMMEEDIGDEVCKELCWRNFFQDIQRDEFGKISRFRMHDLIHDLAQSVMEDTCCIMDDESPTTIPRKIHHLSFDVTNLPSPFNQPGFWHLQQLESLRTCICSFHFSYNDCSLLNLLKFSSLRALDMKRMQLSMIPSSISHLKHLRYLNLSWNYFKTLPKSICSLWNLQILNLDDCHILQKLPDQMKCLKSLCHLSMKRCTSLINTPPKMSQLTCLRNLNVYIVGEQIGFKLAELGCLNLRGELHIKHLERVKSVKEAKEANLVGKHLNELLLSWDRNSESKLQQSIVQILEALEPNLQLRDLGVGGYDGERFPHWMSNPSFKDLCSIEIVDCKNCLQLPPLWNLPSLKRLTLHNLNHVKFIDDDSYDGGVARCFKSLKCLTLTQLPKLEGLSNQGAENIFPCLTTMRIAKCPKLELPLLPSVKELLVSERCSHVLLGSIHNLHGLESLWLVCDQELTSFPNGVLQDLTSVKELHICEYTKLEILPTELINLGALEELDIQLCDNFESFTEQALKGLRSLERLKIAWCDKFKCLSTGFQHLTSLKDLVISFCPEVDALPEALQLIPSFESLNLYELRNLELLPDWLGYLRSLQSLSVAYCPRLMSLPSSIQCLTNLKSLTIGGCPELLKRFEPETGEDWGSVAHIGNVYLRSCVSFPEAQYSKTLEINCRGI